jgi:uncharacterized membrane protein YhhN
MTLALVVVLAVAALDWVAVARDWKRVEILTKPWTLAALFFLLVQFGLAETGFRSLPLVCFAIGLLFSLAGDVFLMLSERWFLAGLVSFLLAHVAYIVGFNVPLPQVEPLWSVSVALILALAAARVLRRIVGGLRERALSKLAAPVVLYGTVITVMLLSALLTLLRLDWEPGAAVLASLGAFLFYLSDIILAWNKFVAPIRNGRVMNMIAYHLGQIALVVGVLIQFAQ